MRVSARLPRDSTFAMEADPDLFLWGMQEQLLATLVEQESVSQRLFIQANSREGADLPDPVRIPRPGVEAEQPKSSIPFNETPAFLEQLASLVPVKE
jgi:hypothetical protein